MSTYQALVLGASGAIGAAFLKHFENDPHCSLAVGLSPSLDAADTVNGQTLAAAGQIAWLMLHVAPGLTTQAQYQALQGLIWQLEGPGSGHTVQFNTTPGVNSAAAIGYFNTYLATLGTNTAPASSVWWINPQNSQNQYGYQGFVAVTARQRDEAVPEPAAAIYRAWALLVDGDAMGALALLAELPQEHPRVAYLQGLALVEQRRFEEAEPWLARVEDWDKAARASAARLVAAGVQAILNFAPVVLEVPENVVVNNVDLAVELENLSYFIR